MSAWNMASWRIKKTSFKKQEGSSPARVALGSPPKKQRWKTEDITVTHLPIFLCFSQKVPTKKTAPMRGLLYIDSPNSIYNPCNFTKKFPGRVREIPPTSPKLCWKSCQLTFEGVERNPVGKTSLRFCGESIQPQKKIRSESRGIFKEKNMSMGHGIWTPMYLPDFCMNTWINLANHLFLGDSHASIQRCEKINRISRSVSIF